MGGVGPSREYLLDLCSQTSMECIDTEEGSHVGCCCGYNPIITLGTEGVAAGVPTIEGRRAEIFTRAPAPPAPTGAAPATPVISTAIDICAKAYMDAKSTVDAYHEDIARQNQQQLYIDAEQN